MKMKCSVISGDFRILSVKYEFGREDRKKHASICNKWKRYFYLKRDRKNKDLIGTFVTTTHTDFAECYFEYQKGYKAKG